MDKTIDPEKLARTNVEKAKRLMRDNGLDALIVNRVDNFRFLTAYHSMTSLFYMNRFSAVLTADMRFPVILPRMVDVDDVKSNYPWFEDIRGTQLEMDLWPQVFVGILRDYGIRKGRVGLDPWIPLTLYEPMRKAMPDTVFTNAGEILESARASKSEEEIKLMREAVRVADKGMQACLDAIETGRTELEVARAGSRALLDAGAELPLVTYMVASGFNSEISREVPTDKPIEIGESVVIDGGGYTGGYCAEFARTGFGGSPSSECRRMYEVVYEAEQRAIEMLRPGNLSHDVDAAAREVIRKAGYESFGYQHVTGHGLGLSVHERPLIGPPDYTRNVELQEGMIVAVEPGIYKPGVGGIRLEDIVLITDGKPEILTKTGYEPLV
ncbi:MAG: aminopeptidase P family protein [Deltaproteobacteria bacterium]|nr:aminopeptidase P family protein [Deltaproteobacteria bacterium]MBW2121451.1 aminopeptidase P family protein [Deltaproteobacteria bacterium]